MQITLKTFFTESGSPKTGITSGTIRIRDTETNALVVTDEAITEIGDGFYKYIFENYNPEKNYVFRWDAGVASGLTGADRYSYAGDSDLPEILNAMHGVGAWGGYIGGNGSNSNKNLAKIIWGYEIEGLSASDRLIISSSPEKLTDTIKSISTKIDSIFSLSSEILSLEKEDDSENRITSKIVSNNEALRREIVSLGTNIPKLEKILSELKEIVSDETKSEKDKEDREENKKLLSDIGNIIEAEFTGIRKAILKIKDYQTELNSLKIVSEKNNLEKKEKIEKALSILTS